MQCNVCGSDALTELGLVGPRPVSVTSDSKLCPIHARIFACSDCAHLQKVYRAEELAAIDAIYRAYDAHHLSQGREQLVFGENQPPVPRTYAALSKCVEMLPTKGALLDVGSGNGAVLKSAGQLLPEWSLHAFDLTDRYEQTITSLPNVVDFSSGTFDSLPPGPFDLIVLWHVLEHVPEPQDLLERLRGRLSKHGFLRLQVPDVRRTPYDLAVIDHCSHFTNAGLIELSLTSGYALAIDGHEWTHNCITLLLRTGGTTPTSRESRRDRPAPPPYLEWLNGTLERFEGAAADSRYAVFGTGMAGLWSPSQLSSKPAYFVDEDTTKLGANVDGVPIITPERIPDTTNVLMPFNHETGLAISRKIARRFPSLTPDSFVLALPDP
jgi:2-polyprenyl-3-methyl-5-hydroxy-6-metoxy-1,4-benzoquinol methylase